MPDPFFIAPAAPGKHTVNLKEITRPTVNLMAQRADLVPCSQSAPFNGLVGSAVGSKARRRVRRKCAGGWRRDRTEFPLFPFAAWASSPMLFSLSSRHGGNGHATEAVHTILNSSFPGLGAPTRSIARSWAA